MSLSQPPFAFIVTRRPLAASAGGRQRYQEFLAEKARESYKNRELMAGRLYIRIIWFTREVRTGDIDNILKGIFDSLQSIVYEDDSRLGQCIVSKVNLTSSYELQIDFALPEIIDELTTLLGQAWSDILYIEVGQLAEQYVVFGPPDGGSL